MRPASRVLVTGGTGFLGSHLVRRMVATGAEVHVLARRGRPSWRLDGLRTEVTLWEADLRDGPAVEACVRGSRPEAVFHLAGATAGREFGGDWGRLEESLEVNLRGTLNLWKALHRGAPGVERIVRLGGLEEYGHGPVPYAEGQRERPVSPYSASQVAATHFGQMLHRSLGLPVVTLRPALVYGPAQAATFFIPALILRCLKGEDFDMTTGEQTRELIFVGDVVEACLGAAAAPGVAGEVLNVGTGQELTVREIAEEVRRLAGSGNALRRGTVPRRPGGIERLVCDPGRARELLQWSASTPLEAGLRVTIDWYRLHGQPPGSPVPPRGDP